MNKLDQLKSMTLVVDDTGDLDAISQYQPQDKLSLDEKTFRWMMNQDAKATEKLADGIRLFTRDQEILESRLVG